MWGGDQDGASELVRAETAGVAGGEGRRVGGPRAKSSRTSSTAEGGGTGLREGAGGGGGVAVMRDVLRAAIPGGGNGTTDVGCAGLLPVESSAMILRIELRISSIDGSEVFSTFDMRTLPRPARSRYTRQSIEPTHSFDVNPRFPICNRSASGGNVKFRIFAIYCHITRAKRIGPSEGKVMATRPSCAEDVRGVIRTSAMWSISPSPTGNGPRHELDISPGRAREADTLT